MTDRDALVEQMARAIHQEREAVEIALDASPEWDNLSPYSRVLYRDLARAVRPIAMEAAARMIEQRNGSIPDRQEIAAAIRQLGGGQ